MPDFGIVTVAGKHTRHPVITMHLQGKDHVEALMYLLESAGAPLGTSSKGDKGWQDDSKDLRRALDYLETDDDD